MLIWFFCSRQLASGLYLVLQDAWGWMFSCLIQYWNVPLLSSRLEGQLFCFIGHKSLLIWFSSKAFLCMQNWRCLPLKITDLCSIFQLNYLPFQSIMFLWDGKSMCNIGLQHTYISHHLLLALCSLLFTEIGYFATFKIRSFLVCSFYRPIATFPWNFPPPK